MRVDFGPPTFIDTLHRSARSEGLTVDGTNGSSAMHAAKLNVVKEDLFYAIHCLVEARAPLPSSDAQGVAMCRSHQRGTTLGSSKLMYTQVPFASPW